MVRKRRSCLTIVRGLVASLAAFCLCRSDVCATGSDFSTTMTHCETETASITEISQSHPFLTLVSTIDGKLTALNVRDGGRVMWTIDAGLGPLISSSLSKMEVMRNGARIRLVPALDGGLYLYDGEGIEVAPITADTLLSSTYKINDDTVVVGGGETQSIGLHAFTGKLQYTCTMKGCKYFGDRQIDDSDDIVVVNRVIKTIRAVDSRTGGEKWNFSVSQHDVQFLPGRHQTTGQKSSVDSDEDASVKVATPDDPVEVDDQLTDCNVQLNVVVPTGRVTAIHKGDSRAIWKCKFGSPIAKVWTLDRRRLEAVSLFNVKHVPALASDDGDSSGALPPEPFLYIGSYRDQVYVQPSVTRPQPDKSCSKDDDDVAFMAPLRVLWRPYLATAPSRTPALRGVRLPAITEMSGSAPAQNGDVKIWTENYPYDIGYYLYPDTCPITLDNSSDASRTNRRDIAVMFWNWWREVAAASIVMTVLLHVIITKYLHRHTRDAPNPSQESDKQDGVMSRYDIFDEMKRSSESSDEHYESYYEEQFEHVQTLGSGGFGVVFEARKRMDEVNYAVKRIPLHPSDEATEKSLREVRTLAKLDHIGIVSYKNSWIESPPIGWQEGRDHARQEREGLTASNSVICSSRTTSHSVHKDHFAIDIPSDQSQGITTDKSMDESGSFSLGQDGSEEKRLNFPDELECNNSNTNTLGNNYSMNNHNFLPKNKATNDSFIVFEDSGCSTHGFEVMPDDNEGVSSSRSLSHCASNGQRASMSHPPACIPIRRHYLFIQMQLCQRENLKDRLSSNMLNRERNTVLSIFDQIVTAVAYVHANGFIHRDLKPSNIFFSMDGVVKIGDFGLVTTMVSPANATSPVSGASSETDPHTAHVGTSLYMSPEQVSGKAYSSKVDIYSLGMILFELFYPFSTEMERIKTLSQIKSGRYPERFVREMPKEYRIIKWLLAFSPDDRPTSDDILAHELLEAYRPRRHLDPSLRPRTTSSSSSS